MNTKNYTVLVAIYEGEKNLEEQLLSIIKQKNVQLRILLSIDPSTDKSELICKKFAEEKSNNISILPTIGKFGGAAPNFFRLIRDVDLSDCSYIALSDQDDIWHFDKLSRAVQMLTKNNCDGYSSNVTAYWSDERQKLIDKAQPQVQWDYLFESAGPGCTFVMTQKLALEVQVFVRANQEAMASVYLHDWFTYAFARSHGYQWYIDKYPSMLYRQHGNNQVGVNTGYKAFLHRMRFVLSGKALNQSSLLATLCGLEDNSFVKRWYKHSRLGLLYLAFHAHQCRRKSSEQIVFFFSCLLLAIVGQKKP
jgi:rhamnosyltransferase